MTLLNLFLKEEVCGAIFQTNFNSFASGLEDRALSMIFLNLSPMCDDEQNPFSDPLGKAASGGLSELTPD
ncbi:hypothetical protein [Kyrpidia spormannii]|uniref:Uncharacterized protein n=2 Tax=Kyrpidia spormannii TaxID=2055160 RepID=A0ACA8ZBY3_9BACL|nr:hypothetical protein [Kyrpidia spormannii]CAB3394329.1 protein of unknown function [Kyrpidia spormannii]CAB3395266.1 protein of unknown function [Kyrpidia spormannii]